jgi:hypothetical protein
MVGDPLLLSPAAEFEAVFARLRGTASAPPAFVVGRVPTTVCLKMAVCDSSRVMLCEASFQGAYRIEQRALVHPLFFPTPPLQRTSKRLNNASPIYCDG